MEQIDYISFDDYLDRLIGVPGTDARDRFEREAEEAVAIKLVPADSLIDDVWGRVGTPRRDEMEAQIEAEIKAREVGDTIRSTRISHNLTRRQLGERAGVTPSQLSRIERGSSSVSLAAVGRVFRALGVPPATIDLGASGRLTLW